MRENSQVERLAALGFMQAPVGLALVELGEGEPGALIAVNRALADLTGRRADELLGLDRDQRAALVGMSPAAAAEQRELLARLAAGDIPAYTSEFRITHRDGHSVWAEITATRVEDEAAATALLTIADVTERRLFLQSLDARRAMTRAFGAVKTVEGAVAALPAVIGPAFGTQFASTWMVDRPSGILRARATWTAPDFEGEAFAAATRGLALPLDHGLPGRAWNGSRCVAVTDLGAEDLPRAQAARADELHGAAAMPIVIDGDLVGVVELMTHDPLSASDRVCAVLNEVATECGDLVAEIWAEERRRPTGELLLVEDNEFIARLVREMLNETYDDPLELVHVTSLADADTRLASQRPQCILLDLNLPDATGLEAVHDIRGRAPEVPIVVLTGEEDERLAVGALREGAQDYLMKRKVDMQGLARSIRYAIERKGLEQELLSHHLRNPLTRLPTRVLFLDQLRVALSRSGPGEVAVLLLDLDRFRRVNNTLGLGAGDQVLVAATERLLACVGDDTPVASLGGDTFAVLLEAPRAEVAAVSLAARLSVAMRVPFVLDGEDLVLTVTIGIALNGPETTSPDELIADADTAASRAKEAGGDRFEIFDEAVRVGLRERLSIETGLRTAVERGELRVEYQPIFSLHDQHLRSVEALVRWQHPDRGLLGPAQFVGIAEETGMIVPIGRWVLHEACRQLAAWRRESAAWERIGVNVNLAVAQLRDPELLGGVGECLAEHGLRAGDLCIEVTETSLMQDVESSVETLEALKAAGAVIALDDFGTGYSSLSYVASLPLDTIKLDRSFVTGFGKERESAIVALVGSMSRALRIPAVAEGIEDTAHIERLRELGYEFGQGYALARPGPPGEVVQRVRPSGSWAVPV